MNAERDRLEEARTRNVLWRKWGPYLSERQWGRVREDYSDNGDAWNFFTHDHARSRAYRWGEDVKEYYFYLDSTPTHSYMKFLYKYPQAAYPYSDLVETNRRRNRNEFEYELLDTGVFEGDRYFDVFVEYAKASPEDILIRVTVHNRGGEEAGLHVLPTLWFRNDWAPWIARPGAKPMLKQVDGPGGVGTIAATHAVLGMYHLYCDSAAPLLFTENSTNHARLGLNYPDAGPYLKDGINDYVVHGRRALLMTCVTLVPSHSDTSSVAAILVRLIAWGGILKASALILFPNAVVAKARVLERAGFLNVVLVVCFVVGAYFTWFGYFAS